MDFSQIFKNLKDILSRYEKDFNCKIDSDNEYYLDTKHIMDNKKPLFFGSVKINKNYVSFHLMPVYVEPTLLNNISSDLKKRMQGKSCFNFKSVDTPLFTELSILTNSCYQYYSDKHYIK